MRVVRGFSGARGRRRIFAHHHSKRPTVIAKAPEQFANRLLAALAPSDRALLAADFEPIELPRLMKLEHPGRRIEHVYFPESGVVSMVSVQDRIQVEVGLIGNEGMTALDVVNGGDRAVYSTYIQIAGRAQRMPAARLRKIVDERESLRRVLMRYAQSFIVQVTQTAVANARATIEERLARWLLMAQDRVESDEIYLTHEFLAIMMGAGRPGVTAAVHVLAQKGMVQGERGRVRILDRDALVEHAGPYYGLAEKEYERLLGPQSDIRIA